MNANRLLALVVLLPLVGCGGGGTTSTSPSVTDSTPSPATTPSPSVSPSVRPDLTGLSGAQLSARARAAFRAAKTLRVVGVVTDKDGTIGSDVSFGRTGTAATFTTKGQRIQFIVIGKTGYMKASDSFWRAQGGKDGETVAELLSGRWLKSKATDKKFAAFANEMRLADFVNEFTTDWPRSPVKLGVKTVSGVECIGLSHSDVTLWVDKYTARPVQFAPGKGSKDKGSLNLSQFDSVREPVAPPASQVIDSSKLR